MQNFHIGDILSVTHDCLVSPEGIGGVYKILNHMSGEELFTHQLPRVAREAAPVLRAALPFLAEIDLEGVNADNWQERMDAIVARHGETHPVPTLTEDQHERIEPLSELAEKVHPDKIVVVDPGVN